MRLLVSLLGLLAVLAVARGQTSSQPTAPPPPAAESPAAQPTPAPSPALTGTALSDRLGALDPRSPWGYFELGEEIAADANDVPAKTLARTLFVLAYETAKKATPEARTGPGGADIRISVCLALASVSSNESEQRWLRAIASSLGWNGPQGSAPSQNGQPATSEPSSLELASALGLIRIGEGRRAVRLLEKPEVSQLLDQTERLLSPAGLTGGAARVRRLMAEWPTCLECKNRRFIKSQEGVRLCPKCGGKPGPKLPQQELLYQLRLESSLLHGVQRSWVAQTIVDGGAPLRDLDPDELAATYRVEPSQTLWRNGRWTVPSASSPAANPAQARPESGG